MKRDALIVAMLIVAACVVQSYMIFRAVTPAQDAVRFVSIAQRMEREGVVPTIRDETEHPLFPAAIRATYPVVKWIRGPRSDNWATAAQWSAALPLVLCVLPIFWLLRAVVSAWGAALGTLVFSTAREFAALGASALSDGWTLLFTCWFLACIARLILRAKQKDAPSYRLIAVALGVSAGIALGLASMAHQLALVSGAAAILMASVLVLFAAPTRWLAVKHIACCAVFVGVGLSGVCTPWLATAGVDSTSSAIARLLGRETGETDEFASVFDASAISDIESSETAIQEVSPSKRQARSKKKWWLESGDKMAFDKKDPNLSLRRHGLAAAGSKFAQEFPQAIGLLIGGFVLIGVGDRIRRLFLRQHRRDENSPQHAHLVERRPLPTFFTGFFLLYAATLLAGAARFGYVEARHLLPLVIVLLPLAVEPLVALCGCFRAKESNALAPARKRMIVVAALMTGWFLAAVPLISPLHASRAPHRQAANWIAASEQLDAAVLDTRGWTQFYSGKSTYLLSAGRRALRDPKLKYIVLERRELEFESARSATLREIVGAPDEPAATFAAVSGPEKDVLVFRWDAKRFSTRKTKIARR